MLGALEEEGYQTEPQTAGQTTSWLLPLPGLLQGASWISGV